MSRLSYWLLAIIWLGLLAGGLVLLHINDARPGEAEQVPERKPDLAITSFSRQLILFAHPKCSCTTDVLQAFHDYHQQYPISQSVRIVFVGPVDAPYSWWDGRNWDLASTLAPATVERDLGGNLAEQFGVRTSGHAVIYSADGNLLFSGGLQSPHGNSLRIAAEILSADPTTDRSPTYQPVFGCSLLDE